MTVVINGTTGITNDGGYTGDGVVFADTTPANTLVTTTGGNVGIGTSSPTAKLTISKSSDSASPSRTPGDYSIRLNAAETNTYNNGICVSEGSFANAAISPIDTGASGAQGWAFITGDNSAIAERARIDSSGNLLVGTTNTDPTGNNVAGVLVAPSYINVNRTAEVAGYFGRTNDGNVLLFRRSGGNTGSVSVTSTTTAYNTSSDYRLKENVTPMTGGLAKVMALKPCTYKWKLDGSDGQGFIAHELAEVEAGCVTGEKDAVDAEGNPQYQGIDTSFLVATLTAAIQEQQALIASQSEIIDAQQAALTALTARVAALDASLDARITSLEGTTNV